MLIRKYREGDEKQIIPLLKHTFELPMFDDDKYWNWMHKNNPTNPIKIWVAEDDGKIIGHYAVMPVSMKIDSELQIGTLSLNTAVHPDYQGQGIFPTLARQTYNESAKEGILITYGYPNERTYPIFIKKLDWFKIPSLPMLFMPLDLKRLLVRKIHNRYVVEVLKGFGLLFLKIFFREKRHDTSEKIDVVKVSSFDDRFDEFWNEASKGYKIITVRDKTYLTWRYLDNPNYNYRTYLAEKEGKILGYIVLKLTVMDKYSKSAMIVDLLTLPDRKDVTYSLISKAIEYFREEGADVVTCYMQNEYYYRLLKKIGFIPIPPKITNRNLCARINRTDNKMVFANSKNWFLTGGDAPHEI